MISSSKLGAYLLCTPNLQQRCLLHTAIQTRHFDDHQPVWRQVDRRSGVFCCSVHILLLPIVRLLDFSDNMLFQYSPKNLQLTTHDRRPFSSLGYAQTKSARQKRREQIPSPSTICREQSDGLFLESDIIEYEKENPHIKTRTQREARRNFIFKLYMDANDE